MMRISGIMTASEGTHRVWGRQTFRQIDHKLIQIKNAVLWVAQKTGQLTSRTARDYVGFDFSREKAEQRCMPFWETASLSCLAPKDCMEHISVTAICCEHRWFYYLRNHYQI